MIIVNLAVVLYVGVTAVLVVLHEGDPDPVHLAPHTELSLLVSPNPREISTVWAALDGDSEVSLTEWEGGLIPATKLRERFCQVEL